MLPPAAVADLATYLYWTMEARDAYEGRSVFASRRGRHPGRRAAHPAPGDAAVRPAVRRAGVRTVRGRARVLRGRPACSTTASRSHPTDWIRGGRLESLLQTRFSADLTGLAVTPWIDNYLLEVDGATGSVDDLVAGLGDGLLLTCLWYIRMVDPQTLLLTGLTRDGVYVVEGGEVTGVANNFRFNESPLDLLGRFTAAGATVPAFSREWGDEFPRTATPPLLVPDFNMSSVSQAS